MLEEWAYRFYSLSMTEGLHTPPDLTSGFGCEQPEHGTVFLHRRLRSELARGRLGCLAGWARLWVGSGQWAKDRLKYPPQGSAPLRQALAGQANIWQSALSRAMEAVRGS